MKIFISYAHDDLPAVRQLAEYLRNGGHDIWYDQRLVGGKPWKDQLLTQIMAADRFLYALTPLSVASAWCQWEFAQAVHAGKPVATVLLEPTTLTGVLADHQYVDFCDRTVDAAIRLGTAIYEAVAIDPEQVPLLDVPRSEPERPTEHSRQTDVQVFFEDAREAFRSKDYETARDWLLVCLDLDPEHAGANALLKQVGRRLGSEDVSSSGTASQNASVPPLPSPDVRPTPSIYRRDATPAASDQTAQFNVILIEAGSLPINVIGVVHTLTGLGIGEANDLIENTPSLILQAVTRETAEDAKAQLEATQAVVEVTLAAV